MSPRTLLLRLRRLIGRLRGRGYEPARHYMRGSGPKSSGRASSPFRRGAESDGNAGAPHRPDRRND